MNLPNKITIIRILLVPVFLVCILPMPDWLIMSSMMEFVRPQLESFNNIIIKHGNYIGAAFFIFAAGTDKVDGYIARKNNLVTKLGIFLDPIADKLLITAALIALVQRSYVSVWAAIIIILREFTVTVFRLMAAKGGTVLAADKWGKAKMVAQTVAISAVLLKNYPFTLFTDLQIDNYLMLIAVLITVYSGYRYITRNSKVLG